MIKDGTNLKATVKQNFEGMADIVCEQIDKYFAGEEIEKGDVRTGGADHTGECTVSK